jgi:hypothetical protein
MKKIASSILCSLFVIVINYDASAQWFLDTATNAEIQAHDQPYIILQKEIETKLCNTDWGIPPNAFLLLKDDPYNRLILRGKAIDAFSFTHSGDACTIQLKPTSPLYKAIMDTTQKLMKKKGDHMKQSLEIWRNSAKNDYKIPASEQKTIDSLKHIDEEADRKLNVLLHEQEFADISLDINESWTPDLGNSTKIQLMPVLPGIEHAVMTMQYSDEDPSDTSYYAYLYIGNWPLPDMKKRVLYTFKYNKHYGSMGRKHSGTPVIENFVILLHSYQYNHLMKAIHSIDWMKLHQLIKSS